MNAPTPGPWRCKRPESVLVIVYTRTGAVLMLRRADHPRFWQSVTGSLEWDEVSLLATARREVHEETGLEPESGWQDWDWSHEFVIFPEWRHRYAPGTTTNREHVFSLELPVPVPVMLNPKEHLESAWLGFPEAHARATSWTNRLAIARVAQARGFAL